MDDGARLVFSCVCGASAVVMISLAAVAMRKGPSTAYLKVWVWLCMVSAIQMTVISLNPHVRSYQTALFFLRLGMTLGCVFQFFVLHFAMSFTNPVRWMRRITILNVIWAMGIVSFLWFTRLILADLTMSELSQFTPEAGSLMSLFLAYIAFTWLYSLYLFWHAYRHSQDLKRTQSLYMLAAFVFGLIGSSGFLVISMVNSHRLLVFLPAALWVMFPLTITYAIVRHRLWDIQTILHRTSVWAVLSLALVLPLYVIIRVGVALDLALGAQELAVLLTLVFLLGFAYLRMVKPHLDHLFQRRTYDRLKVLDRFSRDMSEIGEPHEVARRFMDSLDHSVYPNSCIVQYRSEPGQAWRVEARPDAKGGPELDSLDLDNPFIDRLCLVGSAVDHSQLKVDERFREVLPEAERHFSVTQAKVCLPLAQGGVLVGLVLLGQKRNLKPYSQEDLEFVEQLGAAASVGLNNALLFERVDVQRQNLEELATNLEERVQERTQEIGEVNRKLTEANENLKELDRLKSSFFANISHELRTPLTLILAPLDSMLSDDLGAFDEGQQQQLESVKRSALALLKLIDDLLDLSRLEESRLKLHIENVDLHSLLSRIVDFSKPLAERKNIDVELVSEDCIQIEADEELFERVVVNLLTNAFKFTEPGGRVSLSVGDIGDRALVMVKDTGIGIPAEDLDRVFDRFHQVDSSITRRHTGSGIGLALARELTELHGGNLTVTSEPGKGSTFTVEIPKSASGLSRELVERRVKEVPVRVKRREADVGLPEWSRQIRSGADYKFLGIEAATDRRLVQRASNAHLKSARLMVVDDNPDMLRYLHQILSDQYEVFPVQDGERAWELLLQERHDLIIADVMMPGISGLDLCKRIKSEPETQDVPVILLTAQDGAEYRIEGHGAGADEYISKPFKLDELQAAIMGLLTSKARRTEIAARRRTASMETLLAGMAHELRNACQQVRGAHSVVEKLSRQVIAGKEAEETMFQDVHDDRINKMNAISKRALSRISKVVQSLQQYSRNRMQAPWTDLDFDDLVARQVQLVVTTESKGAEVDLVLNSGASVHGPAEELRQLVLNLVENALQAVEMEGSVHVETKSVAAKVRLIVRDNGYGIPAEVQDRVFDPFFTTKDPGQGMGLGLALCKTTITDLRGTIDLKSQEGKGTEIIVELPIVGTDTQEIVDN